MKLYAVTGHKGAIGSRLFAKLRGAFGFDKNAGFDVMTCEMPHADVVYHLAAQTSVEDSWKDPVKDSYNFNMMVRLVEKYPNSKIIYAQSGASLEASSPYGFSKKVAGDYLKKFHKNYVICVFPNIFGTGRSVVDFFKGNPAVTIYGDGSSIRDYVHVDDIVDGLLKAENWPTGEYFMGSNKGVSVLELAGNRKVNFAPARREMKESILPNTTPNWKPTINVIEYLND